ncbi:hypothetical protein AB674_20955 [Flavobacterium sp. ABG]|nr:hypothetical protein AB674_20955 [Flavobacterium sp. ABG]
MSTKLLTKKQKTCKQIAYRLFVESPGIEPGSKQATKELSTRLFPDWIFVVKLGQEQPLNTYLLNFEIHPKLMDI